MSTGCTALHVAARGGHDGVASLLLQKGAVADATDSKGSTPLHYAGENRAGGWREGGEGKGERMCCVCVGVEGGPCER